MDYEAFGNSCISSGAYFLATGAFFFSLGWFMLGIHKRAAEWLKKCRWFKAAFLGEIVIFLGVTIFIIAGTRMVSKGGTLTTKGWNLLDNHEQRKSLIRAFAQELYTNIDLLENPPMKGKAYYQKEDGGLVQRPFPTLRTNTLNTILSSGLWDFGKQKEKEFLTTITNYERKIGTANYKFRGYNDHLQRIADPNEKIAQAKKLQASVPEKDYFKTLNYKQNQVIKLILNEPRWDIRTQQYEVYKSLQQRIQEKPAVSEPQEGPSKKNSE